MCVHVCVWCVHVCVWCVCMCVCVCVCVSVLPLKSASFSTSSPRSPVTVRACLTFRFVSLRRRRRRTQVNKTLSQVDVPSPCWTSGPTRPVLPSRCKRGWAAHCWRAAGCRPATTERDTCHSHLPLTCHTHTHTRTHIRTHQLHTHTYIHMRTHTHAHTLNNAQYREGERLPCGLMTGCWLTVTNWLFSSRMTSPTWTFIHFSPRSLRSGNSSVGLKEFREEQKGFLVLFLEGLSGNTINNWTLRSSRYERLTARSVSCVIARVSVNLAWRLTSDAFQGFTFHA